MRKLTTILTLVAFYQCKPTKTSPQKKLELILCREISDSRCVPPKVIKSLFFFIENAQTSTNIEDYLNSVWLSGHSLVFELRGIKTDKKYTNKNWKNKFNAELTIQDSKEKQSELFELRYYENHIMGSAKVGSILETCFKEQLSQDYFKLLPCEVKLQLYLGDRFLASRTIDILTSPSEK